MELTFELKTYVFKCVNLELRKREPNFFYLMYALDACL